MMPRETRSIILCMVILAAAGTVAGLGLSYTEKSAVTSTANPGPDPECQACHQKCMASADDLVTCEVYCRQSCR